MKTRIDASKLVSMLLELATAVCMVTGITLTSRMGGGFMGGGTAFLYFTVQSNLWIGATCALFFVLNAVTLAKPSFLIPRVLHVIKFVFTVSITLTGIVFCGVLAPTLPGSFKSAANVLTHVVVPIGCFYWIVVMIAFISLLSLGYIALIGALNQRAQRKELKAPSSDGQ